MIVINTQAPRIKFSVEHNIFVCVMNHKKLLVQLPENDFKQVFCLWLISQLYIYKVNISGYVNNFTSNIRTITNVLLKQDIYATILCIMHVYMNLSLNFQSNKKTHICKLTTYQVKYRTLYICKIS